MKKLIAILLTFAAIFALTACGNKAAQPETTAAAAAAGTIPLTQEETELLEAMGTDVQVIVESDYINMVPELLYHGSEFAGQVFQLEGCLRKDGESAVIYRNLVHNGEKTELGLPVRYLEKEIPDGSWVRFTGIAAVDDDGNTVLDTVAAEVPEQSGKVDMDWAGGELHQH